MFSFDELGYILFGLFTVLCLLHGILLFLKGE